MTSLPAHTVFEETDPAILTAQLAATTTNPNTAYVKFDVQFTTSLFGEFSPNRKPTGTGSRWWKLVWDTVPISRVKRRQHAALEVSKRNVVISMIST
jgi:hypothetical protein